MSTKTKELYSVPVNGWVEVEADDASEAEELVDYMVSNDELKTVQISSHVNNKAYLGIVKGGFTRLASDEVSMTTVSYIE